ncbi:MAG: hypothetical protein M1290_05290 [Candidatus Thermoplasmatota archaeon]|jgi:hypothetical protein|nr:hypothetical protein [Candidatus Thermoplasmatota archaeon]MCL5789859.1 hypothetical protein [Candidatus Thermoplasmatota archaeon]
MYSGLVYIGIAVVVASLHMIAPDHWLPLTALSVKRGYGRRRIIGISALLGFLHGSTSVLLALAALYLGVDVLGINSLKEFSIALLAAVALYIIVNSIRERKRNEKVENVSLLVSILPDPVLLPVVIASFHYGFPEIASLGISFVAATIISLVLVLEVAMAGAARTLSRVRPSTVDYFVVIALVLTAFYILLFG